MDDALKEKFIQDAGWSGAVVESIGSDWSPRRIYRLSRNGRSAILMQSHPDDHPDAVPGHKIADYVRLAVYLKGLQLNVPEVHSASPETGLLLVEDFGSQSFHTLLNDPQADPAAIYIHATDILIHLYEHTKIIDIDLPNYYDSHIHIGQRRVIDWYAPVVRLQKNEDGVAEYFKHLMIDIERSLPIAPKRFLHGDFHPHNLMWVQRPDTAVTGVLDFQGALRGPAAYDLVNLLEDARRIVPAGIQNICLMRFQAALSAEEWDAFSAWYPLLACQFHCRVLGQAIRLAVKHNRTDLLEYIPVLQQHIRNDLLHPTLWPLESFFREANIDFTRPVSVDIAALKPMIRDDAF